MCTRFLYIDGENISKIDIISSVNSFLELLEPSDTFVGKLYGNRDAVKAYVPFCLSNGLTYVETSSISASSKNVTDMKMTVDCISDVLFAKDTNFTVTLLSKDCDFLPLFYKLKEMGIKAEMPFSTLAKLNHFEFLSSATKERRNYQKTTSGLDAFLKHNGFYSPKNSDCLGNLFSKIKKMAGDFFPDSVIEEHIAIKTKKFNKSIVLTYGENNLREFRKISPKDFSFNSIVKSLEIINPEEVNKLYVNYVSKIFGYVPKNKSLPLAEIDALTKEAIDSLAKEAVNSLAKSSAIA